MMIAGSGRGVEGHDHCGMRQVDSGRWRGGWRARGAVTGEGRAKTVAML